MSAGVLHVVIVDDDHDLPVLLGHLITRQHPGTAVITVESATEVIRTLPSWPASAIVLVDRRLGMVESFDLIASMRVSRPDLRIAMISAALGSGDTERALAAGALAAFDKPVGVAGWMTIVDGLAGLIGGDASAS